ncbi:MAG TPA: pectate lyase [Sinorhizobium sp.]|nr:pectate lyase [Sinorhizobium sp.]
MYGVDGNRPVNFDRNSLLDLETGCGGSKVGGGANGTQDFFAGATRKTSPFGDVSGNLPIPSSFLQKPDSGSGMDPELHDVLRKLINWLSDAKQSDSTDGTSEMGDASGKSIGGESGKQLIAAILLLVILQLQDKKSAGNDMNGGGLKFNDLADALEKNANASGMDPDSLSLLKDILAMLGGDGSKGSNASGTDNETASLVDRLFDNNPATAKMDPSLVAILKELVTLLLSKKEDGDAHVSGNNTEETSAGDRTEGNSENPSADNSLEAMISDLLDNSPLAKNLDPALLSVLKELVSLLFGTSPDTPANRRDSVDTGPATRETRSVAPETSSTTKVDPRSESPTQKVETQTEKSDLPSEGEVITVDEPIVVDGGVFDGKGATYTASSNLGDGGQSEGQSPIFILKNGATLKNVNIGENGADGIHVYNGATVENVNWRDVGEDALTVKSPGDVTVIGGSARGAADKIFQVNADAKIYIKDFDADGFTTLVRTNGGKQLDVDVVIDGGSFANGANLFRTDSSLASVTFQSEITLSNVKNWTRVGDQQSGV